MTKDQIIKKVKEHANSIVNIKDLHAFKNELLEIISDGELKEFTKREIGKIQIAIKNKAFIIKNKSNKIYTKPLKNSRKVTLVRSKSNKKMQDIEPLESFIKNYKIGNFTYADLEKLLLRGNALKNLLKKNYKVKAYSRNNVISNDDWNEIEPYLNNLIKQLKSNQKKEKIHKDLTKSREYNPSPPLTEYASRNIYKMISIAKK